MRPTARDPARKRVQICVGQLDPANVLVELTALPADAADHDGPDQDDADADQHCDPGAGELQ
jgi:hypothetical protein